jgi:predicted nucleotidyltransferase
LLREWYNDWMVMLEDIKRLAHDITRLFHPERIILFGSHAKGVANESSDVDLLVVMEYDGRPLDKDLGIWSATRPPFPVDLIIRRPDDVARRYREFDPLIRDALDNGVLLYERRGARVAG